MTRKEIRERIEEMYGPGNTFPGLADLLADIAGLPPDAIAPKRTRGQELAEGLLIAQAPDCWRFQDQGEYFSFPLVCHGGRDFVRSLIANVIDRAIAEERKACAKIADLRHQPDIATAILQRGGTL